MIYWSKQNMDEYRYSNRTTPLAILAGFALVALAVYWGGYGRSSVTKEGAPISDPASATGAIRPVGSSDYIRGNPNAPIMIIEYSDYDCPFCAVFHQTMKQLMDSYALSGKVAWVYRQLPIAELHPNAPRISEAALCVGSLGGNDAFWRFSDLVFSEREPDEPTNMTRLAEFASTAGVSAPAFTECLQNSTMKAAVEESVAEGFGAGITGTPHSILLVGTQQAVIEGAQPYAVLDEMVGTIIAQLEGTPLPSTATGTTAQ
jgi:protein-disulfide isomerase